MWCRKWVVILRCWNIMHKFATAVIDLEECEQTGVRACLCGWEGGLGRLFFWRSGRSPIGRPRSAWHVGVKLCYSLGAACKLFGPVGCAKYVPVRHFVGGEITYSSYHHNFRELYITLHKYFQIWCLFDRASLVYHHSSFSILSNDRSKASSNPIPPHSAI